MENSESISLINEALHQQMEYKFKRAGIPVPKFNIYAFSPDEELYDVSVTFEDFDDNVEMRVKVIKMQTQEDLIRMVNKSGSIETISDKGIQDICSVFSTAIFKQIARKASQYQHRVRGKDCYNRQLRQKDGGMISVSNVTFVDFESLDLDDVNWSHIYTC